MNKWDALRCAMAASVLVCSSAQAELFRAYLASDGNDANPCTLQAPCRLLPAALTAVASGGEIWMLDSANYNTGTVNISKSVSILAVPGVVGSIVALNGGSGISISAPNLKIALRNLVFGPVAGATPGKSGVEVNAASDLVVENSVFANLPWHAVALNGPSTLKVANSTARNNGYSAFHMAANAHAAISSTQMLNNGGGGVTAGIAIGGAQAVTTATVSDCVISGGYRGVQASIGSGGAGLIRMSVTRSTIERTNDAALDSENAGSGTVEVAVGSSLVTNSSLAWRQVGAGSAVLSLGNNQIWGNGAGVGALTPLAPQ